MDKPFEVGPLARMWVNRDYNRGTSVMDWHIVRAQETLKIAAAMEGWLDQLQLGQPAYDDYFDQLSGIVAGISEPPRGALDPNCRRQNRTLSSHYAYLLECFAAG